ncbi:Na+/proline symporter [Methylohalomonas lacus]|uniref:Na+/proline symporter n=1 Tax=Methylohalomonas lacus TaxID=398773 RepID=A0AAE3HHJ0_9GAMM|nr:sodium:solute symporter family protein [Methylohalomonas lacus]MCS3902460.1 Na+/proline symporter [Methylohalomonas lacus]
MNAVLLGVVVYVVIQFAVGLLVSRHIADEKDYLLAGRRLGLGLATFTVFATWFGAETVVGSAGNIYSTGLTGDTAEPFAYALCLVLLGLFFAARLWRNNYTTFGDFFEQRYSSGVGRLFVFLVVPAGVLWAAAQVRAFGQVVSVISDVDTNVAITIAAAVVVIYTAAGGLMATAVTDVIQGLALLIGLLVLYFAVVGDIGGFQAGIDMIDPQRLQFFSAPDMTTWQLIESWAIPICGATLAAEAIARILGARSASTARNAAVLGGLLYFTVGLIPVFLGLIGPQLVPGLDDPEQIVPTLARDYLSTFAYIVFTGALISAILSTVDSALLAAGGLVSHNVIVSLRPQIDARGKLLAARTTVVGLGVIAYVLALQSGSVYELIATAVSFGTAGVFICGVIGLFTAVGGRYAAYAALLTGAIVWFIGQYLAGWSTPYIVSLATALLAYLLAALFEQRAAPGHQPTGSRARA